MYIECVKESRKTKQPLDSGNAETGLIKLKTILHLLGI